MIDLGDLVPLSVAITDGDGQLADASAVTCTVTDPLGVPVELTPTHTSPGVYTVVVTPTTPGRHSVVWLATGTNASAFTDSFTVSTGPARVSLKEAKAFLNIKNDADDEELREFVEVAQAAATEWAGIEFGPVTVAEFHDVAVGQTTLILRQPRALRVESVECLGSQLSADEFRLNPTGELLERVSGSSAAPFPNGINAVEVVYVAGLSPRHDLIATHAIKQMLKHLWKTQRGSRGAPATDEWQSGSGYTFPTRVVELLDPLRRIA